MKLANLFGRRPVAESRMNGRLRTAAAVTLIDAGVRKPARLLELSNKGARLMTDVPPRAYDRILFEWEGKPFAGRVAWVRGKRFGLALDSDSRPADR